MSRFRPGLLPTLLVLALLPLLVWLGFWQLERSEQKRELLERQQARQEATPLTPEQLDGSAEQAYARVYLQGSFDAAHSFLLDSRTRDGQVGVELLQPFYDEPSGRWLLINRGWLPWPTGASPRSSTHRRSRSSSPPGCTCRRASHSSSASAWPKAGHG